MALVKGTGASRRVSSLPSRIWANPVTSIHDQYAPPPYSPSSATWRTPHTSQYGAMPAATSQYGAMPAATAQSDAWSDYAAMSGGGYAMPSVGKMDMSKEAWELVNAAIRQQTAANSTARRAAEEAYQQMLREYTQQYEGGVRDINEAASVDRARLNNMMSSRGISVGEKAAMNFGNLDAGTQRTLGEAEAQYRNASQRAAEQSASRVAELTEKDRILDENAPAQALAIQQQLEAAALDSQLKQQQIAAAQAAMQQQSEQYAGGSGFAGSYGSDDEALGAAAQSLSEIINSGADVETALRQTYIATGVDLMGMAQGGNKRAQMLIDELMRGSRERDEYLSMSPRDRARMTGVYQPWHTTPPNAVDSMKMWDFPSARAYLDAYKSYYRRNNPNFGSEPLTWLGWNIGRVGRGLSDWIRNWR